MRFKKKSEVRAVSAQYGCVIVEPNTANDLRVKLYDTQHNFVANVNPFNHEWKHKPTNVDFRIVN